jgi:TolB-like protein
MTTPPKKQFQFWQELKRRNVLRSLAIYAGTAFIILEATTILFPRWDLPDRTIDLVIWLLVLGAVINVFIAWFYDVTPGGMQKTLPLEETDDQVKQPASRGWKVATYISVVVIVGLIVLNVVGKPSELKAGDIQSLLILPFDNFTGDDQLDYVAAGMHSSLIGDMGQVSGLRIISKTTASAYKELDMALPEMATKLNADAVVEPVVMCYGDSVCIQIRIVTPFPEEKQIWIGEYKEEKSKIMSLYNRVTKQIADEVKVQLTPNEEQLLFAETKSVNPDAYDAYLKGIYYWDQFTPQSLQLALQYFNTAIELDPDWAPPHAGIAYYWIAVRQYGLAPPSITVPLINDNLNKAFKLDPQSANTQYVSALASVWTGFNWKKGEKELLKVLEINPNDAFTQIYYAHLLSILKRDSEAISHCDIALDLDPLNPMILGLSTMALAFTGEYERAIEVGEKALAISPGNGAAIGGLFIAYFCTENDQEGFNTWMINLPVDEETKSAVINTYNDEGVAAAAYLLATQLEKQDHLFPMEIAQAFILSNNHSLAMDWLEKGYSNQDANIPYVGLTMFSEGLFKINDPRNLELLKKMNLPLPN